MTEEEFFINNYPDSCYGDRPLSPHWDFFQEGVEFGERESEKKIQELEQENAELKKEWQEQVQKATDEGYARTLQTIQLTKAKEIIKMLISDGSMLEIGQIAEAEQFLKDSEAKNNV